MVEFQCEQILMTGFTTPAICHLTYKYARTKYVLGLIKLEMT